MFNDVLTFSLTEEAVPVPWRHRAQRQTAKFNISSLSSEAASCCIIDMLRANLFILI